MPPANDDSTSRYPSPPAEPQDPAPYISQALNEALESPVTQHVYNLAATLTTQHELEHELEHEHEHEHEHDRLDADRQADRDLDLQLRSLRANLDEHTQALSQIGVHLGHHDANLDRYQRRFERSRNRLRTLERSELEHRDRTDRLRRVMNRLGRLHSDPQTSSEPRTQPYGDRVPSRNSLYDWSPATDDADDEAELEAILQELRREQPNTHPDILRLLGRSQLDSERERSRAQVSRLLNTSQPSQTESSLRSAALLQSVRRNPRFAAPSRDLQQRYADREATRSPHPTSDWRDRTYESTRQAMERLSQQRRETIRDRDMLQRVDSYRRSYLDRTQTPSSQVNPMVEQTIKYLSKIRQSQSIDDSVNYAIDAGFLKKEYFVDDHQDFVLDPFTLPPPAETSWLAPGAVLSGCQHATHVASTTTLHRSRPAGSSLADPRPTWSNSARDHIPWDDPATSLHSLPPELVTSHAPHQDRWPVKVTIHSIDYTTMTLSATMEAYNVPSHPHSHQSLLSSSTLPPTSTTTTFTPLPNTSTTTTNATNTIPSPYTRTSSITTYLEGEIIDFNTHTLLTESFNSTPATDAMYWRKLAVFQGMSDEEVVRCLASRAWFENVLCREWVLMRWKERCFVKALRDEPPAGGQTRVPNERGEERAGSWGESGSGTGAANGNGNGNGNGATGTQTTSNRIQEVEEGCGLTISGFYYVCLRRSDGRVEGLYYDPQSSPYQCLELESVRGRWFPKWEFR